MERGPQQSKSINIIQYEIDRTRSTSLELELEATLNPDHPSVGATSVTSFALCLYAIAGLPIRHLPPSKKPTKRAQNKDTDEKRRQTKKENKRKKSLALKRKVTGNFYFFSMSRPGDVNHAGL
jgi:hypothetical protein